MPTRYKRLPGSQLGFTLAEVLIAISVSVLFGLAAFATNERLLLTLRSQREAAAATMMLQERMETLRGMTFSNLKDSSYIGSNLINSKTTSEAPLGNVSETITVSAYPTNGSTYYNAWVRDSGHPSGNQSSATLANNPSANNVVQADVLITWTSANGRTRTRDLSALFGIGNLGQ